MHSKVASRRRVGIPAKRKWSVTVKSKEVVVGLGGSTIVDKGCCVGCGCVLTVANRSVESNTCNSCFMVGMAEIEAEDRREDSSFLVTENFAKFFGCDFYKAEECLAWFVHCSFIEAEARLAGFLGCSLAEVEERLSVFLGCSLAEVKERLFVYLDVG